MRQWTQVIDHAFAGFAGGAPGNGWTDVAGSMFAVASGVLHGLTTGTSYLTRQLLRPIGEAARDVREAIVRPAGAARTAFAGIPLRYQTDGDHYLAQLETDEIASPAGHVRLALYTVLDGTTAAQLTFFDTLVAYSPSVRYRLEAEAVGSSTVDFLLAVYDDATGICLGGMRYRHTPTGATASLANAGRQGISVWNNGTGDVDATVARVTTYKAVPVFNVVGLGNSWLAGYLATAGHDPITLSLATLGPDFTGSNLSGPGLETSELIDMIPDLTALYDATARANVAVLHEDRNELTGVHSSFVATPLATARAMMIGLSQQVRALGWRVVLVAPLPCVADEPSTYEPNRHALTDYYRAHWREFADGFVDLTEDERIGNVNSPLDTTYFLGDKTHLTDAGNAVYAEKLATEVARVAMGSVTDGTDATVAAVAASLAAGVNVVAVNGTPVEPVDSLAGGGGGDVEVDIEETEVINS